MQLSETERNRYAKQMILSDIGEAGQLLIKRASVLCVGAGGLGSGLLPYLAAAGVGRIGMIDPDDVELSNLQRQVMYKTSDLGRKKVMAASDYLRSLNPEIVIDVYPVSFCADNAADIIRTYDIVADCTDNLTSRLNINAACLQLDKPFVFAGISRYQGQCMIFDGRHGPCFCCVFPSISFDDFLPDCNSAGVLGVLPGVLGVFQANLILHYILKIKNSCGRLFLMDMLNMQLRDYSVEKDVQCLGCGESRVDHRLMESEKMVSAIELQCKINDDEQFVLLDVRTLAEHQSCHLDSICIPLDELEKRWSELDTDIPIIVYCQTGKRSMKAARFLRQHFKSVACLEGGIVSCQACGMI